MFINKSKIFNDDSHFFEEEDNGRVQIFYYGQYTNMRYIVR